ncbi:4-hydroxythreonine-4-phosphate dehydrogenase PdxA [Engelhardtia mirabilis]|uniref:4-hydroxythreonine-4-phosphate dehydrogenase n=1 Tax=Engelhardtia mirabilis TaxID=2528011 RepID=A0A518BQE9_9BACT|nr:4-hydroxythreonine-4-phosphate dehydrogenase [Planctomycetes bacterium Pla133]QDV03531.1 4-hydroxythreonine-4-phosphate dehydrogenase [Planctomycetes bacterium Pla86]
MVHLDVSYTERPLIGLTVGDPAGIGPEIALKALASADLRRRVRVLVLGPGALRPASVPLLATADRLGLSTVVESGWFDTGGPASWDIGRVQASCGRAALDALAMGAKLATDGLIDALVTGPVNKEALHAAGEAVEGQTELLARWAKAPRTQMLAVAGQLRVLLLTRHLPLRAALDQITTERVVDHLDLLDETLRQLGFESPRLALAGLNPHAGENGILGSEDGDLLVPAVRIARQRGLQVSGPESPDTVFLRASQGVHDGVLALYHDQAFIPVKLLGADRGLTLLAGLPYIRVSPAHGTAFDIAGKGTASERNLLEALFQAAQWVAARKA